LESLVDFGQWLSVRDELIHLKLASHVVINKIWQLRTALDAAERAAFPDTACDELKCCEKTM